MTVLRLMTALSQTMAFVMVDPSSIVTSPQMKELLIVTFFPILQFLPIVAHLIVVLSPTLVPCPRVVIAPITADLRHDDDTAINKRTERKRERDVCVEPRENDVAFFVDVWTLELE